MNEISENLPVKTHDPIDERLRSEVQRLRASQRKEVSVSSGQTTDSPSPAITSADVCQSIQKLEAQGKNAGALKDLQQEFSDFGSGTLTKDEVAVFLTNDMLNRLASPNSPDLQTEIARAEGIVSAGLGGEFSAGLVESGLKKEADWLKNNPGATSNTWGYKLTSLRIGDALRDKLNVGLDKQQVEELSATAQSFSDQLNGRFNLGPTAYLQSYFPPNLKDVLDQAIANPTSVDTNNDGKITGSEILRYLAKTRGIQFDKLDPQGCARLGIAIADSVPNPEWPFFEDLGWIGPGAFAAADTDGNGILSKSEMNEYFKGQVWNKFDFRYATAQHPGSDQTQLADLQWAYQSADCFGLANVGGKDSAELVKDTFKGIEQNFSKYSHNGQSLTQDEYTSALKSEFSTALMDRLNKGVPNATLRDYADLANNMTTEFGIVDPSFALLVDRVRTAANNLQN